MFRGVTAQLEINLVKGLFLSEKNEINKRSRAFSGLGQGDSCKDFLPLPIVKNLWMERRSILGRTGEESKRLHVYLALTAVLT